MHGYTKRRAQNHYLRVDPSTENLGYKRVGYIVGFRGQGIGSFIEENGYPDYLYEFEENGREGFIFYYLKHRKAYVFLEKNWRPTSAHLLEIRELTPLEKQRFGVTDVTDIRGASRSR